MVPLLRGLALVVALVGAALVGGAHRPATAQDGTPAADDRPEVVPYVDEDGDELARLAVREVVDPFEDYPDDAAPEAEERYVLVAVTVANTGEDDLPLDPETFLLRDVDGFLYGLDADLQSTLREAAATPRAGTPEDLVPLAEGDLAPGEERDGVVGYSVREDAQLSEILFVPETGRLLVLAELDDDGQPGLTAGARATATTRTITDEQETPTPRATATPRATTTPTPVPTPSPAPTAPPDTDGDGLTDADEAAVGTDASVVDTDGDGLGDGDEVNTYGTDPLTADTDGDGALDGEEILTAGTDPFVTDTDADGLGDADEAALGTDPFVPDTDGDGVSDGDEVDLGTDPFDPADPAAPTATAAPAAVSTATAAVTGGDEDTDRDGLSDAREGELGTDPAAPDSDDDGLPDGDEVNNYGTNALADDTDGDGLSDLDEVTAGTDPLDEASP